MVERRRWRDAESEALAPVFGTRREGEKIDFAETLARVPLWVRMGPDENLHQTVDSFHPFSVNFIKQLVASNLQNSETEAGPKDGQGGLAGKR